MDTLYIVIVLVIVMFLADWVNYVLGKPLARDYDLHAIMFWLPEALARRKIRRRGPRAFVAKSEETAMKEMKVLDDPTHRQDIWENHRKWVYDYGRSLFTWEKMLVCPVCLHFWLTLLTVGSWWLRGLSFDWQIALLTYLITHFIIKKF